MVEVTNTEITGAEIQCIAWSSYNFFSYLFNFKDICSSGHCKNEFPSVLCMFQYVPLELIFLVVKGEEQERLRIP